MTTFPHEVSLKPGRKCVLSTGWHLSPEPGTWIEAAHEEWGPIRVTAGVSTDRSGRDEVVLVLENDGNGTATIDRGKDVKIIYRRYADGYRDGSATDKHRVGAVEVSPEMTKRASEYQDAEDIMLDQAAATSAYASVLAFTTCAQWTLPRPSAAPCFPHFSALSMTSNSNGNVA